MNILFLHGALSSSKEFLALRNCMSDSHSYTFYDFAGHGDSELPIDFEVMLNQFTAFVNEKMAGKEYAIIGYSMGGYMALYAASKGLIAPMKICTLATKLIWDEVLVEKQTQALNYEILKEKAPSFLQQLNDHLRRKSVQQAISETLVFMKQLSDHQYLNAEALKKISIPVYLLRGDKDHLVKEEDVALALQNIPFIETLELAETPHLLERMNMEYLGQVCENYIKKIAG